MAIASGLHGKGMISVSEKIPDCSITAWRISLSRIRSRFLSNLRFRPAPWTVGNVTPRTQRYCMPNRPTLSNPENVDNLRMYRGLPTTNLDEVGLPFTSNQCVQHALNFGQRTPALTSGRRIGKTHGTGEIAFIVHLDQCQTAVLLV